MMGSCIHALVTGKSYGNMSGMKAPLPVPIMEGSPPPVGSEPFAPPVNQEDIIVLVRFMVKFKGKVHHMALDSLARIQEVRVALHLQTGVAAAEIQVWYKGYQKTPLMTLEQPGVLQDESTDVVAKPRKSKRPCYDEPKTQA